MPLVLEGAVVGRRPLGKPQEGRPQYCSWLVRCTEGGGDFEVLTSDRIGAPGEIIKLPVKAKVATRADGSLMDAVKFNPASGGGYETEWDNEEPALAAAAPRKPEQTFKPLGGAVPVPSAEQTRVAQGFAPGPTLQTNGAGK